MIKPRMTLWERYKVRKNIKRILNENTYYKEFCKRQFFSVHKCVANTNLKYLLDLRGIDKLYKIYILCSRLDSIEIIVAYKDNIINKLVILDDRINNTLSDIGIAIIESHIGIKRLINRDFLK